VGVFSSVTVYGQSTGEAVMTMAEVKCQPVADLPSVSLDMSLKFSMTYKYQKMFF
jgi:hypothetical protein